MKRQFAIICYNDIYQHPSTPIHTYMWKQTVNSNTELRLITPVVVSYIVKFRY